jgi:hypothetical protein
LIRHPIAAYPCPHAYAYACGGDDETVYPTSEKNTERRKKEKKRRKGGKKKALKNAIGGLSLCA